MRRRSAPRVRRAQSTSDGPASASRRALCRAESTPTEQRGERIGVVVCIASLRPVRKGCADDVELEGRGGGVLEDVRAWAGRRGRGTRAVRGGEGGSEMQLESSGFACTMRSAQSP